MFFEDGGSGGKSHFRVSFVWKLILVFVAGVSIIYFLLSRSDQKLSYYSLRLDPLFHGWRNEDFCGKRLKNLSAGAGFPLHYPNPATFSREECACSPVHFFVLLSTQRSGSGWFETLLNSHPNISSHGEIFSVKPRRHNSSIISYTLDTVYDLDWLSSASKNTCTSALGFKWMLNQGALEYSEEAAEYFRRRGVSVLLLLRRNGLKRLISILANTYDRKQPLNGTHVSHVHSQEAADLLASYKPTIDITLLRTSLWSYQLMVENALSAFRNTRMLVVYYEDLVKNPVEMQKKVQKFLSVPVMELKSKQVKIHRGPLSQSVTNWKQIIRELNGTSFQNFLLDNDYN